MLADTGGDRRRINWAAGHGDSQGIGRAGQGLEMHWMEVTLAVTNRCSSFPVVLRRPCHAVSVWSSCSAPNAVIEPQLHCSARICKSMGVRDRLPQTSGWTAQPRLRSCIEASRAV